MLRFNIKINKMARPKKSDTEKNIKTVTSNSGKNSPPSLLKKWLNVLIYKCTEDLINKYGEGPNCTPDTHRYFGKADNEILKNERDMFKLNQNIGEFLYAILGQCLDLVKRTEISIKDNLSTINNKIKDNEPEPYYDFILNHTTSTDYAKVDKIIEAHISAEIQSTHQNKNVQIALIQEMWKDHMTFLAINLANIVYWKYTIFTWGDLAALYVMNGLEFKYIFMLKELINTETVVKPKRVKKEKNKINTEVSLSKDDKDDLSSKDDISPKDDKDDLSSKNDDSDTDELDSKDTKDTK